jgi:GT2 family glycosyltransferase
VVDNGSADGTSNTVASTFPNLSVVRSEENLGAAGGRNLGQLSATGEYLLFVDDDQILDRNCVAELRDCFRTDPMIGLAGAVVYSLKEPDRTVACGFDVDSKTGMVRVFTSFSRANVGEKPMEVPMVGANCMMVSKALFENLGGFDENFFIPYEDADFCLRLKLSGRKIVFCPQARVWHDSPTKSSKPLEDLTPARYFRMARGKTIFVRKHSGILHLVFFSVVPLPGYVAFHSLRALMSGRIDLLKAYLAGSIRGLYDASRAGAKAKVKVKIGAGGKGNSRNNPRK